MRVQRTDYTKEKLYFGENFFFHWLFVFLKKFRLAWCDSPMGVHTKDNKNKKKIQKTNRCFSKKRVLNNIVINGITECQYSKKKNSLMRFFFGYKNYFHEKRILNGLVKIIKGVSQECCKKLYSRKQIVFEKSFSWNVFLNDTVISTVQRSKDRKKIIFRACFLFFTENHFQKDQNFERFAINAQRGTQEWWKN